MRINEITSETMPITTPAMENSDDWCSLTFGKKKIMNSPKAPNKMPNKIPSQPNIITPIFI